MEVPGAFSLEGRGYVKAQLSRPDSLLQAEEWVLGEVSLPDPESVAMGIDSLYESEYRKQWRNLLNQAYVPAFQGPGDAARKLGDLAGDDSPLTQLLSVVSNTVFEGGEADAEGFLPLSAFLPRDSTGRMGLSGSAISYFDALDQLKSAMEGMAEAQGTETLARAEGISLREIPEAEGVVRIIRREMGTEPAGREVANYLVNLLSQPIERAAALVRGVEPAELNRQGAEFCAEFNRRVGSKYPFQGSTTEEPDMDDLAAAFQRSVSLVWNLGTVLDPYIERSGSTYRQRAGSSVGINPAFLEFYGQARRFSESIFGEGSQTPEVEFSVRPSLSESSGGVESISLQVNGRQTICTELDCRTLVLRWDGNASSEVELTARVDGQNVRIAGPFRGPWAVFRLFAGASGWRSPGDPHTIRWQVGGTQRTVAAVVDLGRLPPVFSATLLRNLQCVPRITGGR
jgi:type VI protein secretion system component VasK